MIPPFGSLTGNLPRGEHRATWVEVVQALGFTESRKELLSGLLAACKALKLAGVTELYLDGSFATKRKNPSDYDACYSIHGVDPAKLDPVLLDLKNPRTAMKKKYKGEIFPAEAAASLLGPPYKEFFQKDKNGRKKGIVFLDLGTLP
jgi:hypothetical protein